MSDPAASEAPLQPLHAFLIHLTEKGGKKRWTSNDKEIKRALQALEKNANRFRSSPQSVRRHPSGPFLSQGF